VNKNSAINKNRHRKLGFNTSLIIAKNCASAGFLSLLYIVKAGCSAFQCRL